MSEVIKVLNGGIEFYQDNIDKVSSGSTKAMFNRTIEEKQQVVIELQSFAIEQQGEPDNHSSIAIDIRNMYAKLVNSVGTDKENAYICQLEKVEEKVLEVFDEALSEEQPAECASELRRFRTRMQQCHDEIKSLHQAAVS